MNDLFRRLLGETAGARRKVVVVDLSSVPFDVRTSVISLITYIPLDFVQQPSIADCAPGR
jgi:hypothetical protein